MKIIELKAENIKKLKAIEIKPTENTVVISGKNGAGKSSILDSIWYALTGKDSLKETSKPIREGTDHASVTVDIGDYVITRNWTANDTSYLKVENKEGAKYSSPQQLLDGLIGELSFDPLEFARIEKKAQKEVLLKLLGLNAEVEKLDGQYQDIFNERTFIGRNFKASKAQFDDLVKPRETLPEKEINISDLTKELSEAIENNKAVREIEYDIKENETRLTEVEKEITELLKEKEQLLSNIKSSKEHLTKARIIPIQDLQDKIDNAGQLNNEIRNAENYYIKKSEVEKSEKDYKGKTAELEAIITKKSELIKTAKMPIDGLSFDDEGVLFNAIPFSQLSAAEQLKVSLSIAMSMNPKLKVIRIMDGSLLDSGNMEIIKNMANDNDFQIWIEKVDESGKIGIYIEDGEIKAGR
jgi:energy-coupling factor transporter ATP-binding protein EcfA2